SGPSEPGELHALLRLVRAEPLIDLAPLHVQHAAGQRGIFGEPGRVQLLLRLRQLADRLLGREDPRPRGLVLAAFAGEGAEQGGDERDPAHGRRTLADYSGLASVFPPSETARKA